MFLLYLIFWLAESNLRILSPSSVSSLDDGLIESTTSTFGAPKYGVHLLGIFYEPSSVSDHCDDDYALPINATADFQAFLFVSRGGCSFKRKVLIAQSKGFHAVIFSQDETHIFQEISTLIPADDGVGGEVSIPSVVVSYLDGRRFRRLMRSQQSIIAELSWTVPRRANLRLDMWLTPGSRRDHKMMTSLRPVIAELYEPDTQFRLVPHFSFFSLAAGNGEQYCLDETGEFCAEGEPGLSGVDVAREQLRLMCIRNWAFNSTEREQRLFEYLISSDACNIESFSDSCVSTYLKKSGIDSSAVNSCMNDSTLAMFLLQLERASSAWSPHAIRINGYRYDGEYSSDGVQLAICSALSEDHKPQFCRSGVTRGDNKPSLVLIIGLITVASTAIFGLFFTRGMKQQLLDLMRLQVQGEVRWAIAERKPLALQGP